MTYVMTKPLSENLSSLIRIPTEAEDTEILAAALADPDAQPLTEAQLARMIALRTALEQRRRSKPSSPE
jgi:hypothetical protein